MNTGAQQRASAQPQTATGRTPADTGLFHRSIFWLQTHTKPVLALIAILVDSVSTISLLVLYPAQTAQTARWNIAWLIGCIVFCLLSLVPRRWNWLGPLLLIGCYSVLLFSPHIDTGESNLTYIYALACVVSAIGWTWCLALFGGYCVAFCIIARAFLGRIVAAEVITHTVLGVAGGIIVIAWQMARDSRDQQEQLARLRLRQAQEQENLAIAVRLHDHIANDAAGILAICELQTLPGSPEQAAPTGQAAPAEQAAPAQKSLKPSKSPEPSQSPEPPKSPDPSKSLSWQAVATKAHDIYAETHRLMDLLGQGAQSSTPQAQASPLLSVRLRTALDIEQQNLRSAGFNGHAALTGTAEPELSAMKQREALELVHELAANIRRHMAASGTYSLNVILEPDSCRIVAMNAVPASPVTRGHPSGKGLRLHRRLLRRLGGSLAYGRDDDTWITTAVIPV